MEYNQNLSNLSYEQLAIINRMRLLWEQHVYWTRMLLISIAEKLKDQHDVTDRLLENPYNIADVYAEYYGESTANTIAQLLTEHMQIGAGLITALRDNKSAESDILTKKWYENADKMADAFNSINPYYDRNELQKMLYSHLDLTLHEVAMRLSENYIADITTFNEVEHEAISTADYLSIGIMQQFPEKFT